MKGRFVRRHEAHAAAHDWFVKSGQHAWATNTLTQLGVLRLLTNPAVTQGAVSAVMAMSVLGEATRHAGHEFWLLDSKATAGLEMIAGKISGHQQWTDGLLLRQAAQRGGVFVTFDSGVKKLAEGEASGHFRLLKSR